MKALHIIIAGFCLTLAAACSQQQSNPQKEEGNAVIENIMSRRSIRAYKPCTVARDTMKTILECGINAPSGMNRQSWEVKVLDKPEVITKLKAAMVSANPNTKPENIEGCFRGAPTLIVIANDTSFKFSQIDCGLLSENIMLSAWSLGIGSVCLGSPVGFINNSQQAKNMLGFSEGYSTVICIGLGYANENPDFNINCKVLSKEQVNLKDMKRNFY